MIRAKGTSTSNPEGLCRGRGQSPMEGEAMPGEGNYLGQSAA